MHQEQIRKCFLPKYLINEKNKNDDLGLFTADHQKTTNLQVVAAHLHVEDVWRYTMCCCCLISVILSFCQVVSTVPTKWLKFAYKGDDSDSVLDPGDLEPKTGQVLWYHGIRHVRVQV